MKKQFFLVLTSLAWMNGALAQPIVTISGSNDSLNHLTQIVQCLNYLNVHETIYLHVTFSESMPEHLEGITWVHPAPTSDGHLLIKVRIGAALNPMTRRLVLAHEMIHVKQYVKGELSVVDEQQAVWKGKTYNYQRLAHRDTPSRCFPDTSTGSESSERTAHTAYRLPNEALVDNPPLPLTEKVCRNQKYLRAIL